MGGGTGRGAGADGVSQRDESASRARAGAHAAAARRAHSRATGRGGTSFSIAHEQVHARAAELVQRLQPRVLVNLAAQMDVRKSVADPVFDARTNILGSLNLLEAVRHHSPKTRVVFSSTGGVIYGDRTTPPNVETFEKN